MRLNIGTFFVVLVTFVAVHGEVETRKVEVLEDTRRGPRVRLRSYSLFTPENYDGSRAFPLVVALHPFAIDRSFFQTVTNLNHAAEKAGVIVAYPQADSSNWFLRSDTDMTFNFDMLEAIVDDVVSHREVDKEVVGLAGFSQGASMALSMVSAFPNMFTSVVTVAGTRFHHGDGVLVPDDQPATPGSNVSRLAIHGTDDRTFPYDGGKIGPAPRYGFPVEESVANWGHSLGTVGNVIVTPIKDAVDDGLTSVRHVYKGKSYQDLAGNDRYASAELIQVNGGGHNWPGDYDGWGGPNKPVTFDFSASETGLEFILAHPREYIVGDFSRNGVIDSRDLDILSENLGRDGVFDLTGNGVVDQQDRNHWISEVAKTLPGDADLNHVVDFHDFLAVSIHFDQDGGWREGNFDGIDGVQFPDFVILTNNFGQSTLTTVTPVPEASAIVLLSLALLVLDRIRRIVRPDASRERSLCCRLALLDQ